ncbi:hypothetical protein Mgra_00005217 [Meloidogyne graminicola]|uniref:Uncharacterized protein n=1 Tax=Meloidogyne graminicola TaxID=189291 RepID=A0A8S9ZPB0_9BILA|nr:hypothetical protein Mgra_00005217 [Meloidogyne graminicola]
MKATHSFKIAKQHEHVYPHTLFNSKKIFFRLPIDNLIKNIFVVVRIQSKNEGEKKGIVLLTQH